jgi:hypothetical protein
MREGEALHRLALHRQSVLRDVMLVVMMMPGMVLVRGLRKGRARHQ